MSIRLKLCAGFLYLIIILYFYNLIHLLLAVGNNGVNNTNIELNKIEKISSNKYKYNTSLLIIMMDTRLDFEFFKENIESNKLNKTKLFSSYWIYTYIINRLYAKYYNYKLIIINQNKNGGCKIRYMDKQLTGEEINWCKMEILSYYINNKSQHNYEFDYILYLDSDAHVQLFSFSFNQWLNIQSNEYNIIDMNLMLTNDTPLFIKREMPRLKSFMKRNPYKTPYNCTIYANAGVLLIKNNDKSLKILNEWSQTINSMPPHLIKIFPREQGTFNCLIHHKYSNNIVLTHAFKDFVNIDWFYRNDVYIQHITSGPASHRLPRFKSFLNQIILHNNDDKIDIFSENDIHRYIPYYDIKFDDILIYGNNMESNILHILSFPYIKKNRKYFETEFVEFSW